MESDEHGKEGDSKGPFSGGAEHMEGKTLQLKIHKGKLLIIQFRYTCTYKLGGYVLQWTKSGNAKHTDGKSYQQLEQHREA